MKMNCISEVSLSTETVFKLFWACEPRFDGIKKEECLLLL